MPKLFQQPFSFLDCISDLAVTLSTAQEHPLEQGVHLHVGKVKTNEFLKQKGSKLNKLTTSMNQRQWVKRFGLLQASVHRKVEEAHRPFGARQEACAQQCAAIAARIASLR